LEAGPSSRTRWGRRKEGGIKGREKNGKRSEGSIIASQ